MEPGENGEVDGGKDGICDLFPDVEGTSRTRIVCLEDCGVPLLAATRTGVRGGGLVQ